MKKDYKRWTKLPYAGESSPPSNPEEPLANSWKLFFFKLRKDGKLMTLDGKKATLTIRHPKKIDWNQELEVIQQTLANVTSSETQIAKYWGTGAPTKQFTPIIDRLIDTYSVPAAKAARILACIHAAINDTLVITWYYKFKWMVARPNQLDAELETILCTPRHPSYPAGHGTVAGCCEEMLSYFFPAEKEQLHKLAEECAGSRLYAGVHFPSDNTEGLELGRQIGKLIIKQLKKQKNSKHDLIDTPYSNNLHAELMPPPYDQVIPFNFQTKCQSRVRSDASLSPQDEDKTHKIDEE